MNGNALGRSSRRHNGGIPKRLWLTLILGVLFLILSSRERLPLRAEEADTCLPTFQRRLLATTRHPNTLDLIDMEGDLDLDVVTSTWANEINHIVWLENNGSMGFTQRTVDSTFGAWSALAIDWDYDSDADVLAAGENGGQVAMWTNNGATGFTKDIITPSVPASVVLDVGWIDSGAIRDVVGTPGPQGGFFWWKWTWPSDWSQHSQPGNIYSGVEVVNLNGLSGDEVIGVSRSTVSRVGWFENDGNAGFTEHLLDLNGLPIDTPYATATKDYNGDGDPDIALISQDDNYGSLVWFENDGQEQFTGHVVDVALNRPKAISALDLDDDGDQDLLVVGGSVPLGVPGMLAWYENDGAGSFSKYIVDEALVGPAAVKAADMDRDGDQDIVVADFWGEAVYWYKNGCLGDSEVSLPLVVSDFSGYPLANTAEHVTGPDGLVSVPLTSGGLARFRLVDRLNLPVAGVPVVSIENEYGVTILAAAQKQGFFPKLFAAPSGIVSNETRALNQARSDVQDVPLVPYSGAPSATEESQMIFSHLLSLPQNMDAWEKSHETAENVCQAAGIALDAAIIGITLVTTPGHLGFGFVADVVLHYVVVEGLLVPACTQLVGGPNPVQQHAHLENSAFGLHLMTWEATIENTTGVVFGQVVNQVTRDGVPGATVQIDGLPLFITSSLPNGWYRFEGLNPGSYAITASSPSYDSDQVQGILVTANETTLTPALELYLQNPGTWYIDNQTGGILTIDVSTVGTKEFGAGDSSWSLPAGTYTYVVWATACGGTIMDNFTLTPGGSRWSVFTCAGS